MISDIKVLSVQISLDNLLFRGPVPPEDIRKMIDSDIARKMAVRLLKFVDIRVLRDGAYQTDYRGTVYVVPATSKSALYFAKKEQEREAELAQVREERDAALVAAIDEGQKLMKLREELESARPVQHCTNWQKCDAPTRRGND